MLHRMLHLAQFLSARHDDTADDAEGAEIASNVASIEAIPARELPDGPARQALLALAQSGAEVYAYRPLGADHFNIWIRPEQPWQDGRLSCGEWIARYRASLAPEGAD